MAWRHVGTCRALVVAAIALAVMGGSCGGGDQRAAQSPSATNRTESPTGTNRTESPSGTNRTPYAWSVVAAELTLPANELFGPVAGFDALWLREVGSGTVFRVDPRKNELVATICVGSGCCLAVGEGAVWATVPNERRLLRIDPASNRVTAAIPVGVLGCLVAFLLIA